MSGHYSDTSLIVAGQPRNAAPVKDAIDDLDDALFAAETAVIPMERGGLDADVSAFSGDLNIVSGVASAIKNNLAATAAPTASDDSGDGYGIRSIWIDTTNDKAYICVDDTLTAAVWKEISPAGTGGAVVDFLDLGDVPASYSGAGGQVVKVNGGETGLEFGSFTHNHDASDITSGTLAAARGGLGADASSFTGFLKMAAGAATAVKWNMSATAAPTTGDDSGDGYEIGSIWLDTTNDHAYICLDATATAAVWKQIDGGGSLPFCYLTHSTTQSISNSSLTTVAFDTETVDSDGFHDNVANSRITIPSGLDGVYLVAASLPFAVNSTGVRLCYILQNGSIISGNGATPPPAPFAAYTSTAVIAQMNAADYFQVQVLQTSGGALNLGSGVLLPTFTAIRLGD